MNLEDEEYKNMKKAILFLLFVTIYSQYSFGQFKEEKFTYDIIIGSDFDLMPPSKQTLAPRGDFQDVRRDSRHLMFRLGTNVSYSFSKDIQFTSGLRLMGRSFNSNTIILTTIPCTHPSINYIATNLYLEIPFRSRLFFLNSNNRRFYVEGGIDTQHYFGSIRNIIGSDKSYELRQEMKKFHWVSNVSLGCQFPKENKKTAFYFQVIGKYDLSLSDNLLNRRHLFVGLETGLRF